MSTAARIENRHPSRKPTIEDLPRLDTATARRLFGESTFRLSKQGIVRCAKCPSCDGRARFLVEQREAGGVRYVCRSCGPGYKSQRLSKRQREQAQIDRIIKTRPAGFIEALRGHPFYKTAQGMIASARRAWSEGDPHRFVWWLDCYERHMTRLERETALKYLSEYGHKSANRQKGSEFKNTAAVRRGTSPARPDAAPDFF